MIKLFAVLLSLIVALSFGGMTFAKYLGEMSSTQSTFPLGVDGDKDDTDKEDEDQKMDDDKTGDDKGEDEKEGK